MDFMSVSGENFMSLEKFYVELDNRGLMAIQGINNADSSTISNGAGKSSLSDAISWALYGVTARGSSGDRVVNNHYKKNTKVTVILTDGGTRYRVERYRKHETHKNQCFLFQIDASGTEVDLSKGTDRETQVEIDRVIGAGVDVFNAAIYAGQEQMPNLPGMTDKALKTLLEEASGTEELAECYKIARQDALDASKRLEVENVTLSNLEGNKGRIEAAVVDAQAKAADFETGRRDRAKAELMPVPGFNAELATLKTDLTAHEGAGYSEAVSDCDAKIAAVAGEVQRAADLSNAELQAKSDLNRAVSELALTKTSLSRDLQSAKHDLENVSSKVGKPCSSCGKLYCAEDLETIQANAQTAYDAVVARVKAEIPPLETAIKLAEANVLSAESEATTHRAGMTDLSAVHAARSAAVQGINLIATLKSKIEMVERQIASASTAAKLKMTEPNPNDAYVKRFNEELAGIVKAIDDKKIEISTLETEQEDLKNVVEVFGPAGVRAHILDLITPFLNDKTRDYLGAISDGNIHAVWSTLTKTAKGELKEKFNIEVTNDKGGDSFTELSGGEKRKVRLATAMALQELVASRATKPINLFIADEIDDALDTAGLERLMGILTQRAKDCGTVMVISHNGLSDWVDEVITVEKTDKLAQVTGATHKSM